MTDFIFFFRGAKPSSVSEGKARQPAWDKWFKGLGRKVVDRGAAARSFGAAGDGSVFQELQPTTGYAIIKASSLDEAKKMAATCPIYGEGGVVEVARRVKPESILAA